MSRCSVQYRTGSKETYRRFCEENPKNTLSYNEWCNIVYTFSYNFRDYLLETGAKDKLPHGLGAFAISKKQSKRTVIIPETGEEKIGLPVDWAKTKKAGKYIYHFNFHTDGFRFKLKWFMYSARFFKADIWNFKPSRITSRMITHYLKEDSSYQHKYKEWHLLNKKTY